MNLPKKLLSHVTLVYYEYTVAFLTHIKIRQLSLINLYYRLQVHQITVKCNRH